MLRVYDGGCLWCFYVNEIHDVHRRHSPSCVWRHFAPQGDKQDKNRCADGRNVGCLTALTHYIYYSVILRMGFIGASPVFRLTSQGFLFCFFLSHVKSVIHCFDKNGVKTPDGFLCLRLVDGVWPYLTWTSSRHYDQSPSTVAGATPKTIRRLTG